MIGKTISQYEITEQIGEGGMGVVYKARDTKLKRLVALKFLPANQTASAEQKKRFIREAQAASNLDHTNIGTIYQIDETEQGELFIAMAYYPGDTLKERIAEGALSPEFAIRVGLQMAQGLSKAHQKGIFHRDIKPANILFSEEDEVKIVDFGLAKLADASYLTKTGETMGTVLYMSPEQVQGGKVDHRADIWALGVILYEMLTSKHPFGGDYEHAVMYSIVNEDPEPLDAVLQDVPGKLAEIIEKTLAKEQGNRYQDMEALIADLKVAQEQSGATQAAGAAYRLRALKRKLKKLIRPLAPAFVGLVAALLYFWPTPDVEADQVSIAVLPLKGLGEAQQEEWFQDSMTEEVITGLTKIGGWRVISRTSIMFYKANPKPISEIAEELNVDYVIEGSVVRLGGQIKISVALVDAGQNESVWAENYQRSFGNALKLQAEIAQAIAKQVRVKLSPEEASRFASVREVDPKAHEAYLKGLFHHNQVTPEGTKKSIDLFKKAIEIQPDYALAHAALGLGYTRLVTVRGARLRDVAANIRRAAQRALEIDETVGLAYRVLGTLKRREADFDGAEKDLKRAIELSPSSADARIIYAQLLNYHGRHQEATRHAEIALRLDPLNLFVSMNLAARYWIAGDNRKAVQQTNEVLELNPEFAYAHSIKGFAYLDLKEHDKAVAAAEKSYKYSGGNSQLIASAAYTNAVAGEEGRAEELLTELLEKSKTMFVPLTDVALIYVGLNDHDKAFEYFYEAHEQGEKLVNQFTLGYPPMKDLRSDPRFEEMARKIGLRD